MVPESFLAGDFPFPLSLGFPFFGVSAAFGRFEAAGFPFSLPFAGVSAFTGFSRHFGAFFSYLSPALTTLEGSDLGRFEPADFDFSSGFVDVPALVRLAAEGVAGGVSAASRFFRSFTFLSAPAFASRARRSSCWDRSKMGNGSLQEMCSGVRCGEVWWGMVWNSLVPNNIFGHG